MLGFGQCFPRPVMQLLQKLKQKDHKVKVAWGTQTLSKYGSVGNMLA